MCLTHYVVRTSFDDSTKSEVISRIVNLLRELFHAVNRMFAKHLLLLSSVLSVRFLVLTITANFARTQERIGLKRLSIESGLRRTCKCGSPKRTHSDSTLQTNSDLS